MDRPDYLSKYLFDWDSLNVVISGKSALDSKFFLGPSVDHNTVEKFLVGYGLGVNDSVARAELFGNFQEAVQFIKRYFLIEGEDDGFDLKIPASILMITDIGDLFLMSTRSSEFTKSETLWAEIVLKVMHTILHVDKDLRTNYFNAIQTQIFDRFYKYIHRDNDVLFLATKKTSTDRIVLVDFETKAKKARDSVIIKLLHKAENVAEELFDRVGVRFVTANKFDTLRVTKFLIENYVVIPHNIKPSRSVNTLVNTDKFKEEYSLLIKKVIRNNISEDDFLPQVNNLIHEIDHKNEDRNEHTSSKYQSIQFTCRQLVKYKNPFTHEFSNLRKEAKLDRDNPLAGKILNMDYSLIARDIKFFYPYELQIVDQQSHHINTEGEASHVEYKKAQMEAAKDRLFSQLIDLEAKSRQ